MIRDNVVFVLGAGSSIPYGFPSGSELIARILAVKKDDVDKQLSIKCDQVNEQMQFGPNLMLEFQVSLIRSQVDSIDAFLAHPNNERFLEIGRFLIAATLIPCEKKHVLVEDKSPSPNQSWYKLFWRHLLDIQVPEALADLSLTFVTLNYDRSLEQYLATALKYGMHAGPDKVKEFVNRNIFHVHGSLGSLPGMEREWPRAYSPSVSLQGIREAMRGIKITHEAASFPGKSVVQERLRNADRIVLLGFGYHKDNMQKLFAGVASSASVLASAYGLTQLESRAAKQSLIDCLGLRDDQVTMGETQMGCYEFLRHHFEFR